MVVTMPEFDRQIRRRAGVDMKLVLLLSFKGSLAKWHREGILSREIELYLEHLARGTIEELAILSYDPADAASLPLIACEDDLRRKIRLVLPKAGRKGTLGALLHSLDFRAFRRLAKDGFDLCKTNQISGAWPALILRLFGVPLFARCGYLLSRRLDKNGQKLKAAIAWLLEAAVFNAARAISVTTAEAKATVERMLFGRRAEVFVSPTYVNTDLFRPNTGAGLDTETLVLVGRLEPQKNIPAIVEACRIAGKKLLLIGDGSQKALIEATAARVGAEVTIIPRMQNTEIAAVFRRHRHFILGSLHEGLPKVLIEAMSAGMVCIGTPIPGITDLVTDGETGYLATGLAAADIAAAIARADADSARHEAISQAARALILERHSIATYVEREAAMMRRVVAGE